MSNGGAKATLRSEWPQSINEQGCGIETWPFPPKNDLEPTGDLALEQPSGPTVTVSRSGGVLMTMPASPHFLTGATLPAKAYARQTLSQHLLPRELEAGGWGKEDAMRTKYRWQRSLRFRSLQLPVPGRD